MQKRVRKSEAAFNSMEEKLKQQANQPVDPMTDLDDPAAMRGLLLTYTEKVIGLQATVAGQAPKVAALGRIATADGSTSGSSDVVTEGGTPILAAIEIAVDRVMNMPTEEDNPSWDIREIL